MVVKIIIGVVILAALGGGIFFIKNRPTVASLPACPASEGLLSHSPVAEKDLSTIIPLGNLAPPGHVLPTTHMYYNYLHTNSGGTQVPARTTLYVPADMTVTRMMKMDNADQSKPYEAYLIDFSICKEVTGYFILVQELNEKLAAAMQPPYDETQESDTGSGKKSHNWFKAVDVKLTAGEILGYAGGEAGFPDGLDLALRDTRVPAPKLANPARWADNEKTYVCPLDYFSNDLSQRLYSKIGDYSYKYIQPGDPACGSVYYDEPGTAQGTWIAKDAADQGLWDVKSLAALVESNFDHSKQAFSFGNKASQLGINVSRPYLFAPKTTGNVNLDFSLVRPGQTYCYEADNGLGMAASKVTLLLELTQDNTLRVGSQTVACGTGPWTLTKSVEYVR